MSRSFPVFVEGGIFKTRRSVKLFSENVLACGTSICMVSFEFFGLIIICFPSLEIRFILGRITNNSNKGMVQKTLPVSQFVYNN